MNDQELDTITLNLADLDVADLEQRLELALLPAGCKQCWEATWC